MLHVCIFSDRARSSGELNDRCHKSQCVYRMLLKAFYIYVVANFPAIFLLGKIMFQGVQLLNDMRAMRALVRNINYMIR